MPTISDAEILDCVCLHKQVVEWVACPHLPRHADLGDAVVRLLGSTDPVTIRAVRAACAGGRLSGGKLGGYHGR